MKDNDVASINSVIFILRFIFPLLCSIGFLYLWIPSRSWGIGLLLLLSSVLLPDYGRVALVYSRGVPELGPNTWWSIVTASIVTLGWLIVLVLILRRVFIVNIVLNGHEKGSGKK